MLNLFLFASQSLGQRTLTQTNRPGPDFEVTKCNRQVDNEPEMTIRFSHDYFEDHLLWQVDEFTRSEYGYEKTIPEDELFIDFTDDCKSIFIISSYIYYHLFMHSVLFLNYHIYTGGSVNRKRREVFDDISLNDVPGIQFSCKYERNINVDSAFVHTNPDKIESDIIKTGILEYSASVHDTLMGHDHFTTVIITPKHHLTNVYVS